MSSESYPGSPECVVSCHGADRFANSIGPYAKTKEQVGGILRREATDLHHAIPLMSDHPGVQAGPCEMHPAEDVSAWVAASDRRRATSHAERV